MSRFVQPDKEAEKAFRKMAKDSIKKMGGRMAPYVNGTYEGTADLFKGGDSMLKKIDDNKLVTY